MAQIVNTNISGVNAQRNLNRSQGDLQTAMQRLSSGLRINSAGDDAAGLAISNRFTTQIRGITIALRNANDGVSFAQTAESALAEITVALQRMRDLAVQSANDTNSPGDRLTLQSEVTQMVREIDRIAMSTSFNGRNVLSGDDTLLSFHIGPNSNETVEVTGVDARSSVLGTLPGFVQSTGNRIRLDDAADTGTIGLMEGNTNTFTAISSLTVRTAEIDPADAVNIADVSFGGDIAFIGTDDLVDRFNDNYGSGMAKLMAERINEIRDDGVPEMENIYARATSEFRGSDVSAADYSGSVTPSVDTTVGQGELNSGDLTINGVQIGPVTFQARDAGGELISAINARSETTGVTGSVDANGELVLSAEDGRDIVISTSTPAITNDLFGGGDELAVDRFDTAFSTLRVSGRLTVSGQDSIVFGGTDAAAVGVDAAGLAADGATDNVQAVGTVYFADVTSVASSNVLIQSADGAIDQINAIRGQLGAVQSRFESTIRNLSAVQESLVASNSRILDADFAAESSRLARAQILQQAGISVLSQANALPQQVLNLLQ